MALLSESLVLDDLLQLGRESRLLDWRVEDILVGIVHHIYK